MKWPTIYCKVLSFYYHWFWLFLCSFTSFFQFVSPRQEKDQISKLTQSARTYLFIHIFARDTDLVAALAVVVVVVAVHDGVKVCCYYSNFNNVELRKSLEIRDN